jgi:hypothetical protein
MTMLYCNHHFAPYAPRTRCGSLMRLSYPAQRWPFEDNSLDTGRDAKERPAPNAGT